MKEHKAVVLFIAGVLLMTLAVSFFTGCAPVNENSEVVVYESDNGDLNACLESNGRLLAALQTSQKDLEMCKKGQKVRHHHHRRCPQVQQTEQEEVLPDEGDSQEIQDLKAVIAGLEAENDALNDQVDSLMGDLASCQADLVTCQAQTCPEVEQEECNNGNNDHEGDGNNGHGNDEDHNDDSNPGNSNK